jgi:hypothetical protein
MNAPNASATHSTSLTSRGRGSYRSADSLRSSRRPSDLPRERRMTYVFRTRGRGLVTEYGPD